ncbi:MAG: ABC transporter ATP-binding protein, partial [Betaproteobacteria bacterium]
EGEMLVLVGPSGCGKTTTLRCIAGLESPTAGRIAIDNRVVTAVADGINVPPERREIGMVFQSYAVWPHMTVFNNVAYPLRAIGVPRKEIPERVMRTLKLVQLDQLAERYSSQISGGQQQRVALARSLVAEPKLLLFDEPLSNLDASLRVTMRIEIMELQKRLGFTAVYVTHDQIEAMAIADRIAVMDRGIIRQIGSPRDIYDRPANVFVAGFMGTTNLLEGTVSAVNGAEAVVSTVSGFDVRVTNGQGAAVGRAVHVSVRPEAATVTTRAPEEPQQNAWPGKVTLSTFLGDTIAYRLDVGGKQFDVHAPTTEIFAAGSEVFVAVHPSRCVLLLK